MKKALSAIGLVLALGSHSGSNSQAQTAAESPPQQQVASTNSDQSWRPTETQRQTVEAITRDYFALRDSGKTEQAYALLAPRQKSKLPLQTYIRLVEEFNANSGAAQGRTLRTVTWYKDAPQAGPGLFVAVDYSSQFEKLALHCGYLVWQEQPDGSFLQIREEANVIDNATMAKLKPEQLDALRAQFRC